MSYRETIMLKNFLTAIPPVAWVFLTMVILLIIYEQRQKSRLLNHHEETAQQKRAQNPAIDKRWKYEKPQGLVLGRADKKHYVCLPEKRTESGFSVGHCLVLGGSGTGKTSSVYAQSILADFYNRQNYPELYYTFLAVDIKGELHSNFCPKVISPDSQRAAKNAYFLLDPVDREHSYGFDPFSLVDESKHVTRDLIIQVSSDIASAFVSVSDKDRYFTANALTMLTGFIAFCIESQPRIELVDMMKKLLTENVRDLINDVCSKSLPGSVALHFLGKFQGKGDDNESLDDVISTLTMQLNPFALDSVCYMLRDNPHRISVKAIRKKPIILSVPDYMLDENTFAPIYRMILVSMQRYLISKIPEPGTRPVVLFYDELFSLGGSEKGTGIPELQHFMSIARQYGCAVVAAVQSEKMLEKQYGREGSRILEDNMCKCILQATDPDTIRSAQAWTGKYAEKKTSTNEKLSTNVSWQQQDIFEGSDFTSLVGQKKVIVVPLDDHFLRVQKSQWFKEPFFVKWQKYITQK